MRFGTRRMLLAVVLFSVLMAALMTPGGAWAALGMAILAPVSSYFAMRFHERYERSFDEVVAWLRLKLRPGAAAELRAEREALRRDVETLKTSLEERGPHD